MSQQEFIPKVGQIAAYSDFEAQLLALEKENSIVVFDYASDRGAKEARSHINKLRRTKGALEKIRSAEKAASLEYGRQVDTQAKVIMKRVEVMIDVHQAPLDEIAEKEARRVENIQARIYNIRSVIEDVPGDLDELRKYLNNTKEMIVDESFEEFMAEAAIAKKEAILFLKDVLALREEHAELERLRILVIERERIEREQEIQEEAEAKAKHDAEIERTRVEAERDADRAAEAARIKAEQDRADQAIRDKETAERVAAEQVKQLEQVQRDAQEAANRAAAEATANAELAHRQREQAEHDAALKREQDKEHRAKINRAALAGFVKCGSAEDLAKKIVESIARDEVPNVKILY